MERELAIKIVGLLLLDLKERAVGLEVSPELITSWIEIVEGNLDSEDRCQ